MLYVYTSPDCQRCRDLKDCLQKEGKQFRERPVTRIAGRQLDPVERDHIDIQALAELAFNDQMLPVVVEG